MLCIGWFPKIVMMLYEIIVVQYTDRILHVLVAGSSFKEVGISVSVSVITFIRNAHVVLLKPLFFIFTNLNVAISLLNMIEL
jgi:hypothetical protein